jgi:hypothetical protein
MKHPIPTLPTPTALASRVHDLEALRQAAPSRSRGSYLRVQRHSAHQPERGKSAIAPHLRASTLIPSLGGHLLQDVDRGAITSTAMLRGTAAYRG